MRDNYFKSKEFKVILNKYEDKIKESESIYLDADDFADIADYYLSKNAPNDAMQAVDFGLRLHTEDEVLLSVKSGILIYMHRFVEAREILDKLDDANTDVCYQKAQLVYAIEHDTNKAELLFREWMSNEIANRTNSQSDVDIDWRDEINDHSGEHSNLISKEEIERESYVHIISSLAELCDDEHYDETIVVNWIEEYIAKFEPLGRSDEDSCLIDICKEQALAPQLIKVLTQILELRPYIKNGWNNLALAQFTNGEYENAVESADFALAINNDSLDALLTKAHSLFEMKANEDASLVFRDYLAIGGDIMQRIPLAMCLMECGKKEEAKIEVSLVEAYLDSCKSNDTFDDDMYLRGYMEVMTLYFDLQCYSDSGNSARRVLEVNPVNSDAYFFLGVSQLDEKDIESASHSFQNAVEYANDKVMIGYDIAIVLSMNDYHDFAVKIIDMVDALATALNSPYKDNVCIARTLLMLNKGDESGFLENLKKAITINPEMTKNVLNGYFPDELPVNDYYNWAVNRINEIKDMVVSKKIQDKS